MLLLRMVIEPSGNVGIGTISPDTLLEIRKDTSSGSYGAYPTLSIRNDNATGYGAIHFQEGSTQRARIEVSNNSGSPYLGLHIGSSTDGIRINSSGNVGIGNTSPTSNLTIGSTQSDGLEFTYDSTNTYRNRIANYWNSSTDTRMDFEIGRTGGVAPTTVLSVGYNSNVGIGTTSPSLKFDLSSSNSFGLPGTSGTTPVGFARIGYNDRNTSPSSKLSVGNGSASTFVTINNPSSGDISSGYNINWGSTTGTSLYSNPADNTTTLLSNGDINFRANNGNRLIIKAGGQVGIGISNPQTNGIFSVSCNLSAAFMGHFSNVNGSGYGLGLNTSSGNAVFFYHSFSNVGSITTTSTYTSYATTSDVRLKENIVDAPSASEDIDAIQVRSFDWKADGSHQKYGMVAQELAEVLPSAVNVPEEENRMQSVDYSKLVPMLVKEVQSLRARVAELEGEK